MAFFAAMLPIFIIKESFNIGINKMPNWKDNIYFTLVEPKESGNIGASARAIKNMGFKNLALVKPKLPFSDEARWLAHNALDVLESAVIYETLDEAIKDKSIVAGTSRRIGRKRGMFLSAGEGSKKLYETASLNKVAILFGREDKGLFNEEIETCGFLMTISASKEQPSLNLAQAVLVIAYELSVAEHRMPNSGKETLLINQHELDYLYQRIQETLHHLEYFPEGGRDIQKKMMQNLKHFISRAGLTEWELKMLHGICSKINKKLEIKK